MLNAEGFPCEWQTGKAFDETHALANYFPGTTHHDLKENGLQVSIFVKRIKD